MFFTALRKARCPVHRRAVGALALLCGMALLLPPAAWAGIRTSPSGASIIGDLVSNGGARVSGSAGSAFGAVGQPVVGRSTAASGVVRHGAIMGGGMEAGPLSVTPVSPAEVRAYTTDDPFELSVYCSGGVEPLTYEWQRISPATTLDSGTTASNNTIALTVDPANPVVLGQGQVYCDVTDALDITYTSESAAVTVAAPLGEVTGFEDAEAVIGESFTWGPVSVEGGLGELSYQWSKDDGSKVFQPITGATASTLEFAEIAETDEALYQVAVSDEGGSFSGGDTVTATAFLDVTTGVPAAGMLGLSAMAMAAALGGALSLRRRK